MDEGDLPIQATKRHKGELTSHHIRRMVMYYRLFHFRCTVAKPQHDLQHERLICRLAERRAPQREQGRRRGCSNN
jgi:hypothetical protein